MNSLELFQSKWKGNWSVLLICLAADLMASGNSLAMAWNLRLSEKKKNNTKAELYNLLWSNWSKKAITANILRKPKLKWSWNLELYSAEINNSFGFAFRHTIMIKSTVTRVKGVIFSPEYTIVVCFCYWYLKFECAWQN